MTWKKEHPLDWDPEKEDFEDAWVNWVKKYGAKNFLRSFLQAAQDAEGTCIHCGKKIYLDIIEGGGVPDWRTEEGDYGCDASPDTTDEAAGSHSPRTLDRQ